MSTTDLMIPNAADLPAHIRALTKDVARQFNEDAAAGISTGAPPRVKLNGKQFVMVDGNGTETPFPPAQMVPTPDGNVGMPVILLRAKKAFTKQWFAAAFNPNVETQAPDCYSLDGERPHPASLAKQSEICANCPQNAFGSGHDQNGVATAGKACSDNKILAAFVPGFGVNQFKLPPASLKNFGIYVKQLSAASLPIHLVKTLVMFDSKASFPVLMFAYNGVVDEKAVAKIQELMNSPEAEEIVNPVFAAAAPKQVPATTGNIAPAAAVQTAQAAPAQAAPAQAAPAQAAPAAEVMTDDLGLGLGAKPAQAVPAQAATQSAAAPITSVSDDQLRAELGL
ncbi:MAG: hypothetical protein WC279_14940 [Sulfurimonas sp.]|uniref:hypothetical protein n=1 Tax=Sulfurimonas sp. TaxID=2022749 RepID=UPI0035659BD6